MKAGKPQKPGVEHNGGRKGGGRAAGALDEDWGESMLGQESDGSSLEFECGSLMFDCEDCASGYVCGICGAEQDETMDEMLTIGATAVVTRRRKIPPPCLKMAGLAETRSRFLCWGTFT